jgi:alpha-tubulin suppressor-like RCC1 family protein
MSDPPWGTPNPTIVAGLGPATKISQDCALQADGTVRCFRWNQWGQLGNGTGGKWNSPGTPDHSTVPTTVVGLTDAVDIDGTCAVRATGEVVCWGRNDQGQLAFPPDAWNSMSLVPVTIPGITDAVSVHHNTIYGACAIRQSNKVTCWGSNGGQKFTSASASTILAPVEIPALEGAVDLAIAQSRVCAVLSNGTVRCKGSGMLGNGVQSGAGAVVDLEAFTTAVEVMGSNGQAHHVCVREIEGAVFCWGSQRRGALGNGVSHGISGTPPRTRRAHRRWRGSWLFRRSGITCWSQSPPTRIASMCRLMVMWGLRCRRPIRRGRWM